MHAPEPVTRESRGIPRVRKRPIPAGLRFRPVAAGLLLAASWIAADPARAQVEEDEFSSLGLRYAVLEPLGPKGIDREESFDLFLEYSLLPMISVKGGVGYAEFLRSASAPGGPGDSQEVLLSAAIRYYKASGRVRVFGSFGVGVFLEERTAAGVESTRDADLGLLLGGGVEWTVARHFGLESEITLASSGGEEPDSVLGFAVGPKFFF